MKTDFRLHEWLVQPQLNLLATNGKVARVEPKVMEVLVHLAENAGQVVSKESLMQTIWADRFVTDEVITTSIFELRKALGDEARNPRFIQTIPKRGYRLIAPVIAQEGAEPQKSNPPGRGKTLAAGTYRLWKPLAAGTLLALLVGLVVLKVTVWSNRTANDANTVSTRKSAASAEVTEAYTRGREFWGRRSEEALRKAIEHFEQAIQLDPEYAPAYAGLADSYILLEAQNYLRPEEAGAKAKAAARRAVQLGDGLAEAHASMAFVKMSYDWDWPGAEEEFKQAIALDPDYAMARNWYSQYLLAAGRTLEALREINRARALDPASITIHLTAGTIFYRLHHHDQALEEFRRAIELDPHNPGAFKALGHVYEKKSMVEEAKAAYQRSAELTGLPPIKRFSQDFARWSKKGDAQFLLAKLSFLLQQEYVRPSYIAGLYALFGEKDRAFAWLERAYRERDSNLLFLKTDATWDSLRADPRFVSLEQRVVPAL